MTDWNPNAPNTIGLEWRPHTEGRLSLSSRESPIALLIPSDAGETIGNLVIPHEWAGSGAGTGILWADIYNAADAVEGARTTVAYYPSADKANDGYITRSDWATTTNIYAQISDTSDDEDPWTDYAVNTDAGRISRARFNFATGAFPAGARPLSVTFEIRALGYSWSWQAPSIELSHWYGSNKMAAWGTVSLPRNDQWATYTIGPIYFDANDEGPWNRQSILDFAYSAKDNVGVEWRYGCKITRLTMKVTYVTDKRVAVARAAKITTVPSGVQTNAPLATLAVGTSVAANWSKSNGVDYLAVLRRVESLSGQQFTASIPFLDSDVAPPFDEGLIYSTTLTDAGGDVASVGSAGTRVAPIVPITSGNAQSADAQPYHDLDAQPCHATSTLRQGVNGANVQAYKRVRFLVGFSNTPTAALDVKVKKVSDNSQVGGTGTLAVADLSDPAIATLIGTRTLFDGRSMSVYDVTVTLASTATLAVATDYYLEFSSTTTEAWFPLWVDATASHAYTGNQTAGGSTNQATVAGSGTAAADFLATLGSVPSAIANFAAAVQTAALPSAGDVACSLPTREYVNLTWTASALGASFTRYEIERTEDDGATWNPVAYVTTEATATWRDNQAKRNTAVKYRIRVVRSDGATSDWATLANSVTCTMTGQGLLFVSNEDDTMNAGFVLLDDTYSYQFLGAADLVLVRRYGLDYQSAFRPIERRGVQWDFRVLIHSRGMSGEETSPDDGEGIQAFDTLRDIAETQATVAVLTPDGERLFGALRVPSGTRIASASFYVANVSLIQTSDTPTVAVV